MRKLYHFITYAVKNLLPNAFTFAILLTLFCFSLVLGLTKTTLIESITIWGSGLWSFNNFAMQMVLILLLGGTIAKSPLLKSKLKFLGTFAKSNSQAVAFITFVSLICCYLNWGFGLVVSALVCLEMIKFNKNLNYGLMVASAYSGFLVWHGGISGSIPLSLTNPSKEILIFLTKPSFELKETIFSELNLILLFITISSLFVLNLFLSKRTYNINTIKLDDNIIDENRVKDNTLASRLEHSKYPIILICLLGGYFLFNHFMNGGVVDLPIMITLFFILALLLNLNVSNFLQSTSKSIASCTGIIIQFPLYAGIMSLLSQSGLGDSISNFFVTISNADTFLFTTYLSSGILNFFVPSGGGQWVIQGPIIMKAASELGVNQAQAAMAIAWGDAWTNMIQPFWALPILSVLKCDLKDFMGYSIIIFFMIGVAQSAILFFY